VLQQECRLEEEEASRRIEPNGSDDVSLWHKWMQWTETFSGKDLAVRKKEHMAVADDGVLVDRINSSSSGQECESSGSDENQ
jgi:hypothetical protein